MSDYDLLGASFDCECGKRHVVPTKWFCHGDDAYERLAESAATAADGSRRLLIADARTYDAAGGLVETALRADETADVATFIIPDRGGESPVTDDLTRDLILRNAPKTDLYVAVGSGVVNDLTKWVAFLEGKPYFAVPTAASMNGYASANVAATIDGLKVLFHAEACQGVFADPGVIRDAPYELTSSGLGDVLAKSVSSADWRLNNFLFGDYYCQFSVDLLKELEPVYLENPLGIKNGDPKALKALFEALFFSSLAMTITGTSSPASGGEHLISHTLDMTAVRDNRGHDYHGRQVGVASILTAAIYEEMLALERPVFRPTSETVNRDFWGTLTPVVEAEYRKKIPKMRAAAKLLEVPGNWDALRKLLRPHLTPAAKLKTCLRDAGAAHRFEDIRDAGAPLSRERFVAAVVNANQMRERFTILDLAVMLEIIPSKLDDIIDAWL